MEGCCNRAGTWPFTSIFALALTLTLAFDYLGVEIPKFTPLCPNGWAL